MKTCILTALFACWLVQPIVLAQTQSNSETKKSPPQTIFNPASGLVTASEEALLGKITTQKMIIKIHRMIEVSLSPCEKCMGTHQNYKPKPNYKVLLFEISRRNPNSFELNAQLESTTPLYAKIIGSDNKEYPCYTIPSLIELAMTQKQGITETNAKDYYQLLCAAPPRTEHRAFALAIEIPANIEPIELIWKKECNLACTLNMKNNESFKKPTVATEKDNTNLKKSVLFVH